ncbi:MAG TPA: OmpA family protein [Kofleriaceae bacterium]|nr:OmpA family protein [Kofleriaceae bacterium]
MRWVHRGLVLASLCVVACGSGKKQVAQPKQDDRVKQLEDELAKTKQDLDKERAEADELRKSDSQKADENKALQDKLSAAVGQAGEVTTADGAVKLQLVDQILFPVGEADLTPRGKEVLAKVGSALKEVDKQIWVQGHTDDQPIILKKKPDKPEKPDKADKPDPKAKPGKPGKGGKDGKDGKDAKDKVAVKPAEPEPKNDAVLPFVTNWELSAARALTVVHYLQDEAKIDPTRLAAVAFSQYRPVSKQRAKNRRIEIVLYPKVAISPK